MKQQVLKVKGCTVTMYIPEIGKDITEKEYKKRMQALSRASAEFLKGAKRNA